MEKLHTFCRLCSQAIEVEVTDADERWYDAVEAAWNEHHLAGECCETPHDMNSDMGRARVGDDIEAWINVYVDCGPIYGGAAEGGWYYRAIECWASVAINGTFDPAAEGLCNIDEKTKALAEQLLSHVKTLGAIGEGAMVRIELAKGDEILSKRRKPHYC